MLARGGKRGERAVVVAYVVILHAPISRVATRLLHESYLSQTLPDPSDSEEGETNSKSSKECFLEGNQFFENPSLQDEVNNYDLNVPLEVGEELMTIDKEEQLPPK